jgi:hypothetical protein
MNGSQRLQKKFGQAVQKSYVDEGRVMRSLKLQNSAAWRELAGKSGLDEKRWFASLKSMGALAVVGECTMGVISWEIIPEAMFSLVRYSKPQNSSILNRITMVSEYAIKNYYSSW